MAWETDAAATVAARNAFAPLGCEPTVKRNGRQFLVEKTPLGRVEILSFPGHVLVAVQRPPAGGAAVAVEALPPDIRRHVAQNRLQPWKLYSTPSCDLTLILSELAGSPQGSGDAATGAPASAEPWCPYVRRLRREGELVGESRRGLADQLQGLLAAQGEGSPVPALTGPVGVGRRSVVAAAAAELKLDAAELPLDRVFLVERFLQTPPELFLEIVLAAGQSIGGRGLLVVSDAHLLAHLDESHRRHALRELTRLPHAVLVSDSASGVDVPGVAAMACPGLGAREARRLVGLAHEGLQVADPAMEMLCRAAFMPGVGVVPVRLLYMVRLGLSLVKGREGLGASTFSPDDAAPAICLARQAWDAAPAPPASADE